MFTIGFTNEFYTLWDVQDEGNYYIKNLSKDLEAAKAKMLGKQGIDWNIDLNVRGESTWEFTGHERTEATWADWQFTYGKLRGQDIRTAEDEYIVWQLKRVYNSNANIGQRRRVYARRRLIEMGELKRYTMVKQIPLKAEYCALCDWSNFGQNKANIGYDILEEVYGYEDYVTRYATPKDIMWYELIKGHHGQDATRVVLMLKEINSFSFETYYGTTYVMTYVDAENRMYKYIGSTPPSVSNEEFEKFKATISHSEYKGVAETKLKRIQRA